MRKEGLNEVGGWWGGGVNSNGVSDIFYFFIASFISVSPLLHQYCILPARPEVNCHCLTNSAGREGV